MIQHPVRDDYHPLPAQESERLPTYEDAIEDDNGVEEVRLATVDEKKRRWWRNAFINVLFILSWYVAPPIVEELALTNVCMYIALQVRICHDAVCVQ